MFLFFGRYQLALCKKAMEENIIVYLGTGCGKTHIAVLLMHEMRHLIKKPNKDVCVFLAPTVALVNQVSCCTFDGRGNCNMIEILSFWTVSITPQFY
jgi:ERCC4-related helicase